MWLWKWIRTLFGAGPEDNVTIVLPAGFYSYENCPNFAYLTVMD